MGLGGFGGSLGTHLGGRGGDGGGTVVEVSASCRAAKATSYAARGIWVLARGGAKKIAVSPFFCTPPPP